MRHPRPCRIVPCYLLALACVLAATAVLAREAPAGSAPAAEAALEAMPAHPDLLERVGREEVARMQLRAADPQRTAELRLRGGAKALPRLTGTGTALVILWEFTDHAADRVAHPASAYDELLFSTGVLPSGSMNDFFRENSYGAFGVQGGISGWTVATRTYASYALAGGVQTPSTCRNMIIDAIAQLDPVVNFALYDNDGPDGIPNSGDDDGYVDALFFVHAGPGQEQTGVTSDIWSHAWGFSGGLATSDGVRIYRYSVEPEELANGSLMTVGVFCHEYGHVLGLPDLYDTDYSSNGVGEWCLMSGGSWNHRAGEQPGSRPSHLSAWCKKEMGWLTPIPVTGPLTAVSIPPIETHPVAYRIWRDGAAGGSEYFLVENRRRLGFDQGLVRRQTVNGLPAPEGLLIYHVDESVTGNSGDRHRLVDVEEATPWQAAAGTWHEHLDGELTAGPSRKLGNNNRGDNGDLWPGFAAASPDSTDWVAPRSRDRFADETVPSTRDYFCDPTGVAISNITLSGPNVLADFAILPAAKRLPLAVGTAVFDFETGTDGWQFCRSWVHHDTSQNAGCPGTGGLWFGLDDPSWACPPGYGNGWEDVTWKTLSVSPGATVTIRHRYGLEAGYDFAFVEARCADDPDAPWYRIASYSGVSGCRTDTYSIPSGVFLCPSRFGGTAIDLRLRMTSDEGWSAQDGSYCGIGWWVDQVTVQNAITDAGELPDATRAVLLEPSPNPFNPSTTLRFHVPAGSRALKLTIHDQRGRLVRTVAAEQAPTAGWLEATWDGRDGAGRQQPSGVYFARLEVDGAKSIRKLALVK